ncbi:hypothetical protein F5I97DRAFT_1805537 [Phlebopus sp. FC_14]|nr:hypothetical protein F5I97DRAFT_1805537 [Phlebopus sp. FC_14]
MSIRRKSTTHDLATLRLHPDGSRVQQSSVNSRHRTAGSTVEDFRGNWIALDAGGRSNVKKRRSISVITDEAQGETIQLTSDEEGDKRGRSNGKGKQPTRDGANDDSAPEGETLNTRTKRRLSFFQDFSFLDPPSCTPAADVSESEGSSEPPQRILFSDPAPELLKCVHHFASCYYRERGQLFDSGRDYRGRRKERSKHRQDNIHFLASDTSLQQDLGPEDDVVELEEDHDGGKGDDEEMDVDDDSQGLPRKDSTRKDMYKAFDGSALMAIGS